MPTLDDLRATRIDKLQDLKKLGIDPYPSKVARDQTVEEARLLEGKPVDVVGRVVGKRGHGKISFFDIKDSTASIQVVCKSDILSSQMLQIVELIDIGDFLSVHGMVGKTQAGELSVIAENINIISKSLRPLPDQWHGLKDIEERYRQRYVDLIMNKEIKNVFLLRSQVVTFLRHYLDHDGFIEVETPMLQPLYGGASAKPFITHHNALDADFYLRIAVELYLKRLVVGGFEKVYELGKDFRNEGIDRQHNPEFTMLEFYWAYADYERLMTYTEAMMSDLVKHLFSRYTCTYQKNELNFTPPWPRKTYQSLVLEYTGIDIDRVDTEEALWKEAKRLNLAIDKEHVVGYGALLDEIYKEKVRPFLVGPLFLVNRPTAFVALAKRLPDNPRYTASFQLIIAGNEIVNAYNELNDPIDQESRWIESEKLGEKGQAEYEKLDADYIRALEYGMPPTAGWGMGIDRLVKILADQDNLKDVILFPTLRPELDTTAVIHNQTHKSGENHHEGSVLDIGISYKDAQLLLDEYIKDPVTKLHCIESEAIMRVLARHFGEDEEKWGIIGLLHDIDWELTKTDTKQHCIKCVEILKSHGGTEFLIDTIQSHGFGQGFGEDYYGPPEFKGKTREITIQHALAAAETLTGLIIATTLIQPDKKLASVKPESLIKKYKNKAFAANCRRTIIAECEQIGLPIDQFLALGLKALQDIHEKLEL